MRGPEGTRRSPTELSAELAAARAGQPFLLYRDAEGRQVITILGTESSHLAIGRSSTSDISLAFDEEVSRLHAELNLVGGHWVLADEGLSQNGSFVNEQRVAGRRRLRDRDVLRFGQTSLRYRDPASQTVAKTAAAHGLKDWVKPSERQRQLLLALCRPFARGDAHATPATNKEIAEELHISIDSVKAQLTTLFEHFGIADLPQNQKRARLAELALTSGLISPWDLGGD